MYSVDYANIVINKCDSQTIWYLIEALESKLNHKYEILGGFRGYDRSISIGGVRIAYGGDYQNNTTLISLSGLPLRSFGWYGLASFIRKLIQDLQVKVKLTRIDLAVDIPGALWKDFLNTVYDRIEEKRINTITTISGYDRDFTPPGPNDKYRTNRFNIKNSTIYVGSRTSPRMLRCYAKNINGTHSTRFEMELKENYASNILGLLLTGGTIQQAVNIGFHKFVRLDDYFNFGETDEPTIKTVKQLKIRNRANWIKTISEALVEYATEYQQDYEESLLQASIDLGLPPYGNTGVHLQSSPLYLDQITEIVMDQVVNDQLGAYESPQI